MMTNVARGIWHQFGDRSQTLALEQLRHGNGVGCILSPRYLSAIKAEEYARQYRELGASILWDPEFYRAPEGKYRGDDYEPEYFKRSSAEISGFDDQEKQELASALESINRRIQSTGVIAPAFSLQAMEQDRRRANVVLFEAAQMAAEDLDVPVIGSIALESSVTQSEEAVTSAIASATRVDADAWYLGFEFPAQRIPHRNEYLRRFADVSLTLAATGKPVIHQSAGPMCLLSFGLGATAAGIGHWQNLWQFEPTRYLPSEGRGGSADAPARFFSTALWGTIICPDEIDPLPADLQQRVLTTTSFSQVLAEVPRAELADWSRWESNKHLLSSLVVGVEQVVRQPRARDAVEQAISKLQAVVSLHREISERGIKLRDESSDTYQSNWLHLLQTVLSEKAQDYQYIELVLATEG